MTEPSLAQGIVEPRKGDLGAKPGGRTTYGLHATQDMTPREIVYATTLDRKDDSVGDVRTRHTIEVGPDVHVDCQYLRYANHSCLANAEIVTTLGSRQLSLMVIAKREIKKGDEVTLFYPSFEVEMAEPFDCHCGHSKCLRRIAGALDVPVRRLMFFKPTHHVRAVMNQRLR